MKVVVSPNGSRNFVSNKGSHTVSVPEGPLGNKLLASTKVPNQPIGMAFSRDGTQVYGLPRRRTVQGTQR